MVFLNRLEKYAERRVLSKMQFGLQENVSCIEKINHMLERGSKIYSCFLDVRKTLDMVCFISYLQN